MGTTFAPQTWSQHRYIMTGVNTYSGQTSLGYGVVLRATDGVGLPTGSPITMQEATLEIGGDLVRPGWTTGAAGSGEFRFSGGWGSAITAVGAPARMCIGTLVTPQAKRLRESYPAERAPIPAIVCSVAQCLQRSGRCIWPFAISPACVPLYNRLRVVED